MAYLIYEEKIGKIEEENKGNQGADIEAVQQLQPRKQQFPTRHQFVLKV